MKHVCFDLHSDPFIPSLERPLERPRSSILKSFRFGCGLRSSNPPSVISQQSVCHDSLVATFASALKFHCGDSQLVPLASVYPQFRQCESMGAVVALSCRLAPCAFDMTKALVAHVAAPLFLDPDIISIHFEQVSTLGLRSFLQLASAAVLPITLQPEVVLRDFSAVSSF